MLQLHMLLSIFCTSRAFSLLVLYYYNKVGRHLMEGVGAYVGMYVCRKDVLIDGYLGGNVCTLIGA